MSETATVESAAPIAAPVENVEAASLSEHEATFSPEAREAPETDDDGEPVQRTRHRARSQQASPEDVAQIRDWSARARAAEEAAGIARNDGESERVYRLRVRTELAEAARQARSAPKYEPVRQSAPAASPVAPVAASHDATRPEPNEDEIGTKYQTYAEFTRAQAEWVWEQRDAARQRQAEQQQLQQSQQAQISSYQKRVDDFVAKQPDYNQVVQSAMNDFGAEFKIADPAFQVFLTHDNGPQMLYHLLTHPDQLAEMQALWEGKPASHANVALATRWLQSRVQAVSTGSVAPTPPVIPAPRPPNPVRTGPMKTGDELPGDDATLADHEKAFGKKYARR